MKNKRYVKVLLCVLIALALVSIATVALASTSSPTEGTAPWSKAITNIVDSLTGEVAMGLGVVCHLAGGAKMIHGQGSMEGWAGPMLVAGIAICGLAKAKDLIGWLTGSMLM